MTIVTTTRLMNRKFFLTKPGIYCEKMGLIRKNNMNRIELEKRLISFASAIITLCKECRFDDYTFHLAKQIVRSASSAALNYGEAQSAESRADFTHKLSLVLKELRETQVNITIMSNSVICNNPLRIVDLLKECQDLIAIFQKSINTLNNKNNR